MRLQYLGNEQTKIKLTKKEAMTLLYEDGYDYLDYATYNNFNDDIEFFQTLEELEGLIVDMSQAISLAKSDESELESESVFDYEDERSWYLSRVL